MYPFLYSYNSAVVNKQNLKNKTENIGCIAVNLLFGCSHILFNIHFQLESQAGETRGSGSSGHLREHGLFVNAARLCYR